MHYKEGVSCVFNGRVLYKYGVITRQYNYPISKSTRPWN